jgi:hypothetical protein
MPGGSDMKRLFALFMISMMMLAISGCAAGPNELVNTPDEEGKVAGFWQGAWHGFISAFTFLISLFSDTVHIYEIHNNGGWYNFGFLFGVSIFFGGGVAGRGVYQRRR